MSTSHKSARSEPLEAARAAVQRSDDAQLPTQTTRTLAVRDETRALRDALRALIQHAESLEARLCAVEGHARALDSRTIGSQMLGGLDG